MGNGCLNNETITSLKFAYDQYTLYMYMDMSLHTKPQILSSFSDMFNATTLEMIHSITVSTTLLQRLAELYNRFEVSKFMDT